MKKIIKKIKKIYNDNSIFGVLILIRIILSKLYSKIFLSKYHIKSDYSSYIYGLKHMIIGSLSLGRHCRIEMITKYNDKILKPKLVIGNSVIINDRVHIGCANYIEIGDYSLLASDIYISDHNHGLYKGNSQSSAQSIVALRDLDYDKKVIIGKNVWIGEHVSILPGAIIGDNAIIGANSVVTGFIPNDTIAVGSPASVIKKYNYKFNVWKEVE